VQFLDGFATTRDNVTGKLPEMLRAADCTNVRQTGRFATVFGALALYGARKPSPPTDFG
jgi:hypothetical protein